MLDQAAAWRESLDTHARLPRHLRLAGVASPWGARVHGRAGMDSFLEGLLVDEAGGALCVDIAHGRILQLTPDGQFDALLTYDGEPNGLARGPAGTLLISDQQRGLLVWDPADGGRAGGVPVVHDRGAPSQFLGLNDVLVASDGTIYLTDQGESGLHDPSGRLLRVRNGEPPQPLVTHIPSPNAMALRADGQQLYVAVTRDNAVWQIPLGPDGAVGRVGRHLQLSGGIGPDGLALTADGHLLVTHLGLGVVWVFDPDGRLVGRLETHIGSATTSVAVRPGTLEVFVTESDTGTVLTADLGPLL